MFSKVYLSTQLIKYTFKLIAQLADFNNGCLARLIGYLYTLSFQRRFRYMQSSYLHFTVSIPFHFPMLFAVETRITPPQLLRSVISEKEAERQRSRNCTSKQCDDKPHQCAHNHTQYLLTVVNERLLLKVFLNFKFDFSNAEATNGKSTTNITQLYRVYRYRCI